MLTGMGDIAKARLLGESRVGRKGREQVRVSGRERMPRAPDKRGPHSCMRLLAAQRVQSILVPPLGPPISLHSLYTATRKRAPSKVVYKSDDKL